MEMPKYKIFKGLSPCDFIKTDLKFRHIKFLYVLLNEKDLKETGMPVHRKNCFIQDPGHDWHMYKDGIKIAIGGAQFQLVDILIELY